MSIGRMRERIRFVRSTRTKRSDGGYDVVNTTIAEVWAAVNIVRAMEGEQVGRLRHQSTHVISIRRNSALGVTADDTILWLTNGDKALNIREIRDDGPRAMFVTIVATGGDVL